MTGLTKAELENKLKQTEKAASDYKDEVRDAIVEEATNQGLDCEVLDQFLESVDMEPRGANYLVTVPVKVRADSEDEAMQLVATYYSGFNESINVQENDIKVKKL